MKQKIFLGLFCGLLFLGLFFVVGQTLAQTGVVGTVELDNPLAIDPKNVPASQVPAMLIGQVIKTALGVIGGLALAFMVWGGFQWLTSAGNQEKVSKGTQTMLWAVIGLILTLSSYLLADTFITFLAGRKW